MNAEWSLWLQRLPLCVPIWCRRGPLLRCDKWWMDLDEHIRTYVAGPIKQKQLIAGRYGHIGLRQLLLRVYIYIYVYICSSRSILYIQICHCVCVCSLREVWSGVSECADMHIAYPVRVYRASSGTHSHATTFLYNYIRMSVRWRPWQAKRRIEIGSNSLACLIIQKLSFHCAGSLWFKLFCRC